MHGGGFRSGSRASFAPGEQGFGATSRALARLGFATFAIDYRLAPRFPFLAAEHDLLAELRWVRRNAHRLGVDPKRLGLFGASAGGSFAALAATDPDGALDAGDRVSWSGPVDLSSFYAGHPFVAEYLGCVPAACPARYTAGIVELGSKRPPGRGDRCRREGVTSRARLTPRTGRTRVHARRGCLRKGAILHAARRASLSAIGEPATPARRTVRCFHADAAAKQTDSAD